MFPRVKKLIEIACFALAGAVALVEAVRVGAAGGDIDTTFNPGGAGANVVVRAMAFQTDGRAAIGGRPAAAPSRGTRWRYAVMTSACVCRNWLINC